MGPSGQPLEARFLWNFAHRFRCAAAIFLRADADILCLLPFRGVEFEEDSSRRAEITLSSFFSSFLVWERSARNVLIISTISILGM
jgi:hypothetical protein